MLKNLNIEDGVQAVDGGASGWQGGYVQTNWYEVAGRGILGINVESCTFQGTESQDLLVQFLC